MLLIIFPVNYKLYIPVEQGFMWWVIAKGVLIYVQRKPYIIREIFKRKTLRKESQ